MDFSNLQTRSLSDRGAFLHLRSPLDKKLLNTADGHAAGVYVRGWDSRTVTTALRSITQGKLTGLTTEEAGIVLMKALCIRFVNVHNAEGRLIEPVDADLEWFCGLSASFEEQIVAFSKEVGNFLSEKKAGVEPAET